MAAAVSVLFVDWPCAETQTSPQISPSVQHRHVPGPDPRLPAIRKHLVPISPCSKVERPQTAWPLFVDPDAMLLAGRCLPLADSPPVRLPAEDKLYSHAASSQLYASSSYTLVK